MKADKQGIILTERAADSERLRAVLRDWGYHENEIYRVLTKHTVDQTKDRPFQKNLRSEVPFRGKGSDASGA